MGLNAEQKLREEPAKIIESQPLPELPSLEDLAKNLFQLEEDMLDYFQANGDLHLFYLPFLSFLVSLGIHIQSAFLSLERPHKPFPLSMNWESSYTMDQEESDFYYKTHQPVNEDEIYSKWIIEIELFYECLMGHLRRIYTDAYLYFDIGLANWQGQPDDEIARRIKESIANDTSDEDRGITNGQLAFYRNDKAFPSFRLDPAQWNLVNTAYFAQWLAMIIDPQFRPFQPNSFFIYLNSLNFPSQIPRVYRYKGGPLEPNKEKSGWATGFGGRLIVPNLAGLSPQQKSAMWDYLLIDRNIYDDPKIDHSPRAQVFAYVADKIPQGAKHLDLCGGRGDFIAYLSKADKTVDSTLIDIASQAVAYAKATGIRALEGNADEHIPVNDDEFDIITIIFAVQWLQPTAFKEVLRVLKPEGMLVFNVYPPVEEEASEYQKLLRQIGFVDVVCEKHQEKDRENYIVTAKKKS